MQKTNDHKIALLLVFFFPIVLLVFSGCLITTPQAKQESSDQTREEAKRLAELGDSYREKGDYQQAIVELSKAIELDPDYDWALAHRGESYRMIDEIDLAIADLDRAIELDPEYSWALASRGECFYEKDDYAKAIEDLTRAIDLDPDYEWAFAHRGNAHRMNSDYETAIKDFDRAIELDPDYEWAIARRGEAYRMLDKYAPAIADLSRAIELNPKNDFAYASRGQTYREMGEHLKALADLNKAIELDPDYSWAIERRKELYEEIGEQAEKQSQDRELPLITVLDLRIENLDESVGNLIVDLLSSALISTKKYRVLDRSQREAVMKEIEYSHSDSVDEEYQLRLGRLLAADKIVIGSLGMIGKRYILNLKMLNVETGEAVSSSYQIFNSLEELVDGTEKIAVSLTGS
jgi:tetratricopeptide (TPR) repeat protein